MPSWGLGLGLGLVPHTHASAKHCLKSEKWALRQQWPACLLSPGQDFRVLCAWLAFILSFRWLAFPRWTMGNWGERSGPGKAYGHWTKEMLAAGSETAGEASGALTNFSIHFWLVLQQGREDWWNIWGMDRDGHLRRFSWALPLLRNSTFQSGHWDAFCTQVVASPAYPPGPPWGRTFLWKKRDKKGLKLYRTEISVRQEKRAPHYQTIQIYRLHKVKSILGNLTQDLTWRKWCWASKGPAAQRPLKPSHLTGHVWLRNNFLLPAQDPPRVATGQADEAALVWTRGRGPWWWLFASLINNSTFPFHQILTSGYG